MDTVIARRLFAFLLIVVLGNQNLFASLDQPIQTIEPAAAQQAQETYYPEAFVSAEYGQAPDQVGINRGREESYPVGPAAISIGGGGEVYLIDSQNNRVLELLAGDQVNEVFPFGKLEKPIDLVRTTDGFLLLDGSGHKILKYDLQGEQIDSIPLPAELAVSKIYVNSQGNILYSGLVLPQENVDRLTTSQQILERTTWKVIEGHVPDEISLQETVENEGVPTRKGIFNLRLTETNAENGIVLINGSGSQLSYDVQVVQGKTLAGVSLLDQDSLGNFYIKVDSLSQNNEQVLEIDSHVHKVSPGGDLLARVDLYDQSYTVPVNSVAISPEGEIYQLITDYERAHIVRWSLTAPPDGATEPIFETTPIQNQESGLSLEAAGPAAPTHDSNNMLLAITRDQAIANAEAYSTHRWTVGSSNFYGRTCSNTCPVGNARWGIGTTVTGVAYKWGGEDSVANFDSKLSQGYIAGDVTGTSCVGNCATGVDCSGFVTNAWQSSRFYTGNIGNVAQVINVNDIQKGDAFNIHITGKQHVVLFSYKDGGGNPIFYESQWDEARVVLNTWGRWNYLSGYTPYRYNGITGGGSSDTTPPTGGFNNPGAGSTITSRSVQIEGWGQDSGGSGFDHAHFTAFYNGSWRQISQEFTSSPFGFDWDMCAAGVPNGQVTLGLDIWDRAGNAAYSPGGTRIFTKNVDCSGSPTGSWTANYYDTIDRWWDTNNSGNHRCSENVGGPTLDKNYGISGPCGMDGDSWVADYSATINFPAGNYVFMFDHDDGLKFWLNGQNIADFSSSQSNDKACPARYVSGNTNLRALLREDGGDARIKVWWTTDTSVCVTAPGQPSLISPGNNNTVGRYQSVTVSWNGVSGATSYLVEFTGDSPFNTSPSTTSTSQFIGDNFWGGAYHWRVRARNSAGEGPWSETRTLYRRYGTPGSLSASTASSSQINLSWSPSADAPGNIDGYRVYRSGTAIGTVGPSTNSYQSTGLSGGTRYCYTVKAYRGGLESDASTEVCATTQVNQPVVSGYVREANGTPVSGVVMSGLPGSPQTDANGYYRATLSAGWSGTATPQKAAHSFSPASRSYSNVTTEQANQNYTGTKVCYTLSTIGSPSGSGTVQVSPQPNCGSQYLAGTSVTLRAVPGTGFAFNGWSGSISGMTNPVTVTMNGSKTITASFVAGCPTSYTGWKGEYWNNRTLSGSPVLCRDDAKVAFDWGSGSPHSSIPVDNFSVRWTRQIHNNYERTFRFHIKADDGVRFWIDGVLVLDRWIDQAANEYLIDRKLSVGSHTLKVEYYEAGYDAVASAWWELTSGTACPTSFTGWKGEYWNNRFLIGSPLVCRDDSSINFNWGSGRPDPKMSADQFSARWTRTIYNRYARKFRFHISANDGVRFWVDGVLVLDRWLDQSAIEHIVTRDLSVGNHTLKMEYYENGDVASAKAWWEVVTPVPCPTTITGWKGEYFDNMTLSGTPMVCRDDPSSLAFTWNQGSPAVNIPADKFSARFTRTIYNSASRSFRFHVQANDGVRLYIDNVLVLNRWVNQTATDIIVDRYLSKGNHVVRVEYYDNTGVAEVRVWWQLVNAAACPAITHWQASFWNNTALSGNPVLCRNDGSINFDWGGSAPAAGVPADGFSVRWDRTVYNNYSRSFRFHVTSDDGVRVWIDGVLVLDKWFDQGATEYVFERHWNAGSHRIKMEYYENGGGAVAKLWWEVVPGTGLMIDVPVGGALVEEMPVNKPEE